MSLLKPSSQTATNDSFNPMTNAIEIWNQQSIASSIKKLEISTDSSTPYAVASR